MPRSPSSLRFLRLLPPTALLAVLASGCGDADVATPNQPPDTVIEAGPPEGGDTSYRVSFAWSGSDSDGEVAHFELAWDSAEDWRGPVTSRESTFVVLGVDSCETVRPPFAGPCAGWHTFRVRAVDDDGAVDGTEEIRSFNARTIAPWTLITEGPRELGHWATRGRIGWEGHDDDGVVVGYRYALASRQDYVRATGDAGVQDRWQVIAWLDTTAFYPDANGGLTDSVMWQSTTASFVDVAGLREAVIPDFTIFAVRAVDDAGAVEPALYLQLNTRVFFPRTDLDGPRIEVRGAPGYRTAGERGDPFDVFAGRQEFRWRTRAGPSGKPAIAVDLSLDDGTWMATDPDQDMAAFDLATGNHTFSVRARDEFGFERRVDFPMRVHDAPRDRPGAERTVLVVLDTSPLSLQNSFIWPGAYRLAERALLEQALTGYRLVMHETSGTVAPAPALLSQAEVVVWVHSAIAGTGGDPSVLQSLHAGEPNVLAAWLAAGGKLVLCGLMPSVACAWGEDWWMDPVRQTAWPYVFGPPEPPGSGLAHWAGVHAGIGEVARFVYNTNVGQDAQRRLARATSRITSGPNPYSDLPFDPLTWPQGTVRRGFGFYDLGLEVVPGSGAEVIYTANGSDDAVAVRRLAPAGGPGSVIWLGLHPYFVERPAFRAFLRAALADFGVLPED